MLFEIFFNIAVIPVEASDFFNFQAVKLQKRVVVIGYPVSFILLFKVACPCFGSFLLFLFCAIVRLKFAVQDIDVYIHI